MEAFELKDMENWVLGGDIRVIQKSCQEQEKCHHFQIILRETRGINILAIVGNVIQSLPKQICLVLGLSIKKQDGESDSGYYCTQCGKYFDKDEYKLYKSLFQQARCLRADAWKLKNIFENRAGKSEKELMKKMIPGRQRYSCTVSRLEAAGIVMRKDENELYDEEIKRFKIAG